MEKLRDFAVIQLVACIIFAVLVLLLGIGTMGFAALIYVAILVFSALISYFSLQALADAAEYAKSAAYYSEQIAMYINRQEKEKEPPENSAAVTPGGKMPAWQRVEMEKAEAERKAAEENQ